MKKDEPIDITEMSDEELLARFQIPESHPEKMLATKALEVIYEPEPSPRLFIGSLGNGKTLCDVDVEEHADYKKIAHWQPNTNVLTLYSTHEPRLAREAVDIYRRTSERVLLLDRRRPPG